MRVSHLEILSEERSMEAFLEMLLPRMLPAGLTFLIHPFRGKDDLLKKLQERLNAYAKWLPAECRLVVAVDRDDDDCHELKAQLEQAATDTGLLTRSQACGGSWQAVNRIVVEELEAWYFGDWQAVRQAYPRVSANVPNQARYRDPDAIQGGTSEAFERILKKPGRFQNGLRKTEAARDIAPNIDPARNRSRSFRAFRDALTEATA